ncbi:ATP-dependent zinc protease [Vibrio breoganii]|uniref:ATP-dependent zinc protease family protein n=1 Tax=Vibrio breoganii TaxID=553239 RepID=UPI000C84A1EA|nr:ATP-dependent zinc protease [Vibrio breoganii]PML98426.1 ATP-dependent Zn protease [Vibrio breoganii]PMN63829.1 ATP-dependent Zn protease [Vibrio breoganii]
MLKHIVALSGAVLLSGCATSQATQEETRQYRTESIQAVKSSEYNLSNQISNLQLSIDNQNDYIESLEGQLVIMSNRVDNLAKQNARVLLAPKQEEKQPKPKAPVSNGDLVVLGSIETVKFEQINQTFEARIDTGAATSSLNAINIQEFERNGNTWVKFNLSTDKAEDAEPTWIEAPLIRYAKVRQSNTTKTHRRAVIELWINLGDVRQKAQFTLADRSHMTHPVLLGREFIKDIALVDVSKEFIQTEKQQ